MLGLITSTSDPERSFLPFKHDGKDEVILMINNLGGISELEITSIVNDTMSILKEQKILVKRVMAGSFMVRLLAKKSPSTLAHLGVRHLFITDITQSSWIQHHPSSPA
jgi:dihydroxyacetone kinase